MKESEKEKENEYIEHKKENEDWSMRTRNMKEKNRTKRNTRGKGENDDEEEKKESRKCTITRTKDLPLLQSPQLRKSEPPFTSRQPGTRIKEENAQKNATRPRGPRWHCQRSGVIKTTKAWHPSRQRLNCLDFAGRKWE